MNERKEKERERKRAKNKGKEGRIFWEVAMKLGRLSSALLTSARCTRSGKCKGTRISSDTGQEGCSAPGKNPTPSFSKPRDVRVWALLSLGKQPENVRGVCSD